MKETRQDKIFNAVNLLLCTLILLIVLYPIYFIIIASVSDPMAVVKGQVYLWPKEITLEAYQNVFSESQIWTGYGNTIFYTLFGTLWNLALTIPCAYVLSKKDLPGHSALSWFFFITMYFSGGIVPSYMLYKDLGLLNTRWACVLGAGVNCWNLIVTRTFFSGTIPNEVYEAAEIDGASDFRTFFFIAVPLSASIIAIMALFYGVEHWNEYFWAMCCLTSRKLFPLQMVLRDILIENQQMLQALQSSTTEGAAEAAARKAYMAEAMKYALIFISAAPMLIAYPFVQKYFVKGVMIGSVKG